MPLFFTQDVDSLVSHEINLRVVTIQKPQNIKDAVKYITLRKSEYCEVACVSVCVYIQGGNGKCIVNHDVKSLTAFSLVGKVPGSWSRLSLVWEMVQSRPKGYENSSRRLVICTLLCKPETGKKGNLKDTLGSPATDGE